MAPAGMIDPSVRPTKVDRASDVTGLVDTGELVSAARAGRRRGGDGVDPALSDRKLRVIDPKQPWLTRSRRRSRATRSKELVHCGYVKSADLADRYGDPTSLNPDLDPDIVGPGGIFTPAEYDGDDEFRKTAAVMKMVHRRLRRRRHHHDGRLRLPRPGPRDRRDARPARRAAAWAPASSTRRARGLPLMLYVFSDGSLSANGMVDNTVDGRGKFVWTSDNQSTAASFFLVYNPGGRPNLVSSGASGTARHQQIGWFRADGSVETASTPAAANVNLLVETVVLNYMALHGEQGQFASRFPRHGLGNATLQDSLIAFNPIV